MVIGEETAVVQQQPQPTPPANIDNIMSGIGNTGTVKMNNHRKKLRQRFDIIKKLGQGTYGKVQLGINKETGQEVAIKTIKKCKIETEADLIRIRREVQIMSSVQHPNIIHIYEVFENKEKMVLVMEFAAGGELYDYLSERKVLSEDEARRVFRQIATAIYYCHKHKICHRDLKLENILLDEHGSAKIADFGLSNVFDEQRLLATFCGSPLYASPEIVKGTPYQGPEVDCWSLGVLLYTLVYGAMPFDGSNFKRLVKQISAGEYYEPKKASAASPLIREMLTVCPKSRATIESICNHWWVNEGYNESCLDLAEELANQTPVRLDVLLSLSPPAVTADQLVVPTPGLQESMSSDRVSRSHSVGSVIDMANTEAERRIIDMVVAGGEAALMPSPTRTITPAESPAQTKRKLEQTVSTENATGAVKKKEKPFDPATASKLSIAENMELDPEKETQPIKQKDLSTTNLQNVENMCDELLQKEPIKSSPSKKLIKKKINNSEIKVPEVIKESEVQTLDAQETNDIQSDNTENAESNDALKSAEKRKSRIFETAEKFQNMNNQNTEKNKRFGASVGNVGNFKKEFEKKASMTGTNLATEKNYIDKKFSPVPKMGRKASLDDSKSISMSEQLTNQEIENAMEKGKMNDSRSSIANFSLEEARKSMENSIALLNQAKNESNNEVDQLCAQTENVSVSENDREKKLKSAREVIGNAILPGRLCMGVRKPPVPFGINGRSISGSVIPSSSTFDKKSIRVQVGPEPNDIATATYSVSTPEQKLYHQDPISNVHRPVAVPTLQEKPEHESTTKTSRAEIVLKSATLPRRKPGKPDVKLEIENKQTERGMRFSTEMQHHIPDLRSAPIREHPYSPVTTTSQPRSTSLEPKEIIIPIQRPPSYQKSNVLPTYRPGSLSRQSTNDSDTESTQIQTPTISSSSTIGSSNSQPIKKSPREFIIPIAVEGGGYVTPRAGSLEPSDSNSTTTTTSFSKIGRPRRMGSLLSDKDIEEESPFQKLHRHTSIGRDSDNDEPRFHTMHRLRSTRPLKRLVQDPNDSASSGDDDDEDGFEILTAENLFSTLLSRVRALTNRMNVNDTHGFPSTRLMGNLRQPHNSFWNHDPFASNLNKSSSSWRHSISRDLGSDIDSMFSRSGATLPRGTKFRSSTTNKTSPSQINQIPNNNNNDNNGKLDLQDLDLSRLRLTKKDLETLSNITPTLPKEVQDQLLAQLPPNQARKLSRTLSMQNSLVETPHVKPYKRSLSGGREMSEPIHLNKTITKDPTKPINNYSNNISSNLVKSEIFDRNSIYRRSLSKTRYDNNIEKASRSSSRCRDSFVDTDESSKSLTSDVLKYRTYRSDYDNSQSTSTLSPTNECFTNLPPLTGCISPPPLPNDASLRRRSTSKRISRFLRPDFYDTPREESIYVKDNKDRDPESKRLLREIRERSRERSIDRLGSSSDRLNYLMDKYSNRKDENDITHDKYIRHSSVEGFCSSRDNMEYERRSRSTSKSNDNNVIKTPSVGTVSERLIFADKIINELQNISKLKISNDKIIKSDNKNEINTNKIMKNKSRETISSNDSQQPTKCAAQKDNDKINDITMVTNLTKEIDSIALLSINDKIVNGKTKVESKISRPKSYPSKSNEKSNKKSNDNSQSTDSTMTNSVAETTGDVPLDSKLTRPKSYPNSKITPPKDLKKSDEKSPPKPEKPLVKTIKVVSKIDKDKVINGVTLPKEGETKTVKKVIKTVKKSIKSNKSDSSSEKIENKETLENSLRDKEKNKETSKTKEKSPEKKIGKGFLYSIGQKFEKFRENSKGKDKKVPITIPSTTKNGKVESNENETCIQSKNETNNNDDIAKKKNIEKEIPNNNTDSKFVKVEKKSKIDTMIRNLREKSVPRSPLLTESRLLKRAVSVEDIAGGYNRSGVNKVLGLFKKYEKDNQNHSTLKNTKSSSNVECDLENCVNNNKSIIFDSFNNSNCNSSNKPKKINQYTGAKSDTILTITEQSCRLNNTKIPKYACAECSSETQNDLVTKRYSMNESQNISIDEKEKIKNKRKGLMLDFSKIDNNLSQNEATGFVRPSSLIKDLNVTNNNNNNNSIDKLSNISTSSNNVTNNNFISYPPPLPNDINRNHNLIPSYDNLANYSSESRSPYDDCASTSTLFSPTDEPELCFDNWSVCSDDHTRPTPSPSMSRYSRNSHIISSPLQENVSCESIVDRIRRKSFYSRFNEKKPRRVSSIVGPAAKEYYRDSSTSLKTAVKPKPLEYKRSASSSIDNSKNTHEYYHPMKTNTLDNVYHNLSSSQTKLSYDADRNIDYKPKPSSINYHIPTTNLKHNSYDTDYNRYSNDIGNYKKADNLTNYSTKRSSVYDAPSLSSYTTAYHPRSSIPSSTSSYLNGTTNLETYATLGRKFIKPYEQRSATLMNTTPISNKTTINNFNRDQRVSTDFGTISRHNLRIRTPTTSKSPSNT